MRILMVCTGNTCRSPMAAALMRDALARRGVRGASVCSAGVYAIEGECASLDAQEEMARRGLSIQDHRATPIAQADARDALVLCMTRAHLDLVRRILPNARLDTLMGCAGLKGDVNDPIGGGPMAYRRAADQMDRAIGIIADAIANEGTN